jgi:hypothetical protein
MPVDTQHPHYESYALKWQRARDASAGQDAVHSRGYAYLPKLKDQSNDDYNAYKLRASYFNATGRTIDGLVGMVFRKEPEIEQTGIESIIDDADLQGNALSAFAQHIVRDVLTVSRIGVLVEYPSVQNQPVTQAQALEQNLRPYLTLYPTETIINWKEERVNNVMTPTFVMLAETASLQVDAYETKSIPQLRELRLENGVYVQKIWQKAEKKKEYELIEVITPLMNGRALNFIPFYAFGGEENTLTPNDSPILPLADLNLSHYRVTADYEHGCHYTGLPMLFLSGLELGDKEKIYLGSQTAVVAPNPDADGKFIEFTGQGLGALEKNLDRKERQMAVLGARLLEQQKNGVESEGAMQMRSNGETSALASIAKLVSDQLSNMLSFMAQWAGAASDVEIELNTDYMPVNMTAQELTAIVQAWQAGAISKETLFNNLKRGEVIAESSSYTEEEEKISNSTPVLAE